jgi:hypothetical protein
MNQGEKIFLIAIIILADMLVFMLPLTAFFAAYVIWFRPPWFQAWVEKLYGGD